MFSYEKLFRVFGEKAKRVRILLSLFIKISALTNKVQLKFSISTFVPN